MNNRKNFICVTDKSPVISNISNADFYLTFQIAILDYLERNGLINHEQNKLCKEDIIKKNNHTKIF